MIPKTKVADSRLKLTDFWQTYPRFDFVIASWLKLNLPDSKHRLFYVITLLTQPHTIITDKKCRIHWTKEELLPTFTVQCWRLFNEYLTAVMLVCSISLCIDTEIKSISAQNCPEHRPDLFLSFSHHIWVTDSLWICVMLLVWFNYPG